MPVPPANERAQAMGAPPATPPHDPGDMMGAVRALPDQFDAGWARVRGLVLPPALRRPSAVVVVGMGGSAIGGDLAAATLIDKLPVPMTVVRDYTVPPWVGPTTLVIGASFSGQTEETRAAFADAGRRGAARIAVTSGGAIGAEAEAAGLPVVHLPPGGQPRAALGAGLAAILGILHAAGLIADPTVELTEATRHMRALVDDLDRSGADHVAAALAAACEGRLPIVYAPEDLAPVARRWKTQLNENAKTTAAWDLLPELDHNAVVGYARPVDLAEHAYVVLLSVPGLHPRLARRILATADLLAEHGVPHRIVTAPRAPRMAQALWLVQLGDLASVLLAYRYGLDPSRVDAIDRLKAALG